MEVTDQRKHPRTKLKQNCNAALVQDRIFVGQIDDISMGGLSCNYLSDSERADSNCRVDIFNSHSLVVLQLPCTVVYNTLETEYSYNLKKWRCGVEFGYMNKDKEKALNYLIEKSHLEKNDE